MVVLAAADGSSSPQIRSSLGSPRLISWILQSWSLAEPHPAATLELVFCTPWGGGGGASHNSIICFCVECDVQPLWLLNGHCCREASNNYRSSVTEKMHN